ncbi:MAG TPA: ATP-binding protein [bacterium]|nr:ATP-binding protein [bacterium]HPQ20103.1 ATP-binding protein [bacterium]
MISTELLKEIIISNQNYINELPEIISRQINLSDFYKRKVCILYGPRRSGKTFILYDIFLKNKNNALYIDFADERLVNFELEDFQKLQEAFFELNPHLIKSKNIFFLLDEIQNIEGWEKYVRRAVEKENINVIVTGSSSKMMPYEIHTALRGRAISYQIYPLSFAEYLLIKGIELTKVNLYNRQKVLIKNSFKEYLEFGGFPEVALFETKYQKQKVLKEYLDAMFFKDLVERYKISNISIIDILRDNLFSSYSQKFSISALYKKYKINYSFSKDTLFKYYRYFIDSMLIFEIPLFNESHYRRQNFPKKIYLVDNGLAKKIVSENYGRLLENIIFLELLRKENEIYYLSNEYEYDFIVKKDKQINIFQICWELTDKNKEREIEGLIKGCKYFNIKKGYIITYEQEFEEKIDGILIKIVPAFKWLVSEVLN